MNKKLVKVLAVTMAAVTLAVGAGSVTASAATNLN